MNTIAEQILKDAASRISDMNHEGEGFSLAQQDAIINAVNSVMNGKFLDLTEEPSSAADLTAESNDPRSHAPVTFKVDNVPIRVGQDMRIEYEDKGSGNMLIVILTHEGIIMDAWDANGTEPTATSSIMYDEQMEDIKEMFNG